MIENPFEPSSIMQLSHSRRPINRSLWTLFGFLIACVPIALLGVSGLISDARYASTLPENTVRCGNTTLGLLLLVFPISPLLGVVGALGGFTLATLLNVARARKDVSANDVVLHSSTNLGQTQQTDC